MIRCGRVDHHIARCNSCVAATVEIQGDCGGYVMREIGKAGQTIDCWRTEVALQREQAVLDSNISTYRSELARLAVTVGDIDIRIQDTQNNYERRILGELQDARTRLQEIDASLPSAREVRELRLQQAGNTTAFDALAASRRIVVTRTINNQVKQMDVAEDTLLEPGDVVDIKKVRTRERAKGASIEAPKERAQANADSRVPATTCTWANGRRSGAACV